MPDTLLKNKKIAAVILAAGSGLRMGKSIPKQFLKVNGKAVFLHTLRHFLDCNFFGEILIVVNRDWINRARKMTVEFSKDRRIKFVIGGKNRKDSVYSALIFLKDRGVDYVLFHDAVRPFINKNLIAATVADGIKYGAAIAGIEGTDLVAELERGKMNRILDSRSVFFTQTPECYKFDLILKIHEMSHKNKNLRRATNLELMLAFNKFVKLVKYNERNLKLTYSSDLRLASSLLGNYNK